ncbi:uncharacterized protein LOC141908801 [Tubulanus polymorphus]|uniref:uncharacterized protein LOC141908801 n=1 Tax=Tubulanus polymorphus TaxID=672921 RepID=UPI003DA38A98
MDEELQKRETTSAEKQLGAEAFVIDFKSGASKKKSLQKSFLKFKREKQAELREARKIKELELRSKQDPQEMYDLRKKFLETAKKYFGVPYKRKYWSEEDAEYNSPKFLDCCGLVRQIMRDLQKDFGFRLGPWNQAYMYDLLPIDVQREQDMKPGDLVFISGIYHNKKSKKQRHNMVHVEIWAGDGIKTIGARWQKGKVQVFDSYKFKATAYHSCKYHFKSIDTWLMGICKSYCPTHPWKKSKFKKPPSSRSIFALSDDESEDDALDAGDTDDELVKSHDADELAEKRRQAYESLKSNRQIDESAIDSIAASGFGLNAEMTSEPSFILYLPEDGAASTPEGCKRSEDDDENLEIEVLEKLNVMESSDDDDEDEKEEIVIKDEATLATDYGAKPRLTTLESTPISSGNAAHNDTAPSDVQEGELVGGCNQEKPTSCLISPAQSDNSSSPLKGAGDSQSNAKSSSAAPKTNTTAKHQQQKHRTKSPVKTINQTRSDCKLDDKSFPRKLQTSPSRKDDRQTTMMTSSTTGAAAAMTAAAAAAAATSQSKPSDKQRDRAPKVSISANQTPVFYIGGHNGVSLVETPLLALGWKRTTDKYCDNFKLKWTESKGAINFNTFKEGEQLVNHIPNCSMLTNKLGLINSLKEYERVMSTLKKSRARLKFTDIFPETYNIDDKNERERFLETYNDGEIWICKPTGLNQGKGIYLFRNLDEIKKTIQERDERSENQPGRKLTIRRMPRIVQRYINDPLLVEGKKFDIRAYMMIPSTSPFMLYYHGGYLRLSIHKYNKDDADMTTHLTNQYIQKKDPMYKEMKEDTVWSEERFNEYINEKVAPEKGLQKDWVFNVLAKQMQKIMRHCFECVRHKLGSKVGFFAIYGFDFMIDDNMKVWLIEININPALNINCEVLKDVLPPIIEQTIGMSLECFDKARKNQPILPLKTSHTFELIYNGDQQRRDSTTSSRRASVSPARQTRSGSISPVKEPVELSVRPRANSSPYHQAINLPKINARSSFSNASSSIAEKPTSTKATAIQSSGGGSGSDSVKLKMTHGDTGNGKTSRRNSKADSSSRGN